VLKGKATLLQVADQSGHGFIKDIGFHGDEGVEKVKSYSLYFIHGTFSIPMEGKMQGTILRFLQESPKLPCDRAQIVII
jgi:hypothetical protein